MKKNKRVYILISIFISIIFFTLTSYQSIKLYSAHKTRGDLTNFAQAMWNTTQGRMMQNTFNYSIHNFWGDRQKVIPITSNIFGIHFNPLLFLFVPFYALYPSPMTLLLIQTLLVGTGGVLMFFLTRKFIKNDFAAVLIQISFLLHIGTVSAVLTEFHAYSLTLFFGPLLLFTAFSKTNFLYYSSLLLYLFIQENTGIPLIFFGFYISFVLKNWRRGLVMSILSFLYVAASIKLIIPFLSLYKGYIFDSAYGSLLGSSMAEIILNGIANPLLLFKTLVTAQNGLYVLKLLFPVFPAVLFAPIELLFSIPSIATNLISSSSLLKGNTMHYEAAFVPFIYFACIMALKRIRLSSIVFKLCLVLLTLLTLVGFRKFGYNRINLSLLRTPLYSAADAELDRVITLIPKGASVSTQDYISGHLTNRRELYLFPVYASKTDYVLVSGPSQSSWPLEQTDQIRELNKLKKNYKIKFQSKNVILLER